MAEMKELGVLRVARPCPAKWSKMLGDDTVRFCARCGLDVYDLSTLTADQARQLIGQREGGRLCVRFWARRDGTVITRDCLRPSLRLPYRAGGGVLALATAVLLCVVSLFGDSLRQLFGMSTMGALAGEDTIQPQRRFDAEHPPPPDAPDWLKRRAQTVRAEPARR